MCLYMYLKYQLVDVDVLLNSHKLELEMVGNKKGEFEFLSLGG